MDQDRRQSRWILTTSACVIATAVIAYVALPGFRGFVDEMLAVVTSDDPDRAQHWVAQYGWKGPVLIVGLMTVQMFLIVVPSWLLMVISVLVYGKVWGTVISLVAVVIASSVGYAVGAALGEQSIHRLLGSRRERRVRVEACRYGVWAVFAARLSPLFSNDAISLVGGLLRMGYLRFIVATIAGLLPLTLLIAAFGRDAGTMKRGLVWLSVLSLLGLAAKIWYDKKRAKRADDPCEELDESASSQAGSD